MAASNCCGKKDKRIHIFGGAKSKTERKARKVWPFYAKIAKFGLIVTHLNYFFGGGGQENILGEMPPPVAPLLSPTAARGNWYYNGAWFFLKHLYRKF